jgi:hypothetical protein
MYRPDWFMPAPERPEQRARRVAEALERYLGKTVTLHLPVISYPGLAERLPGCVQEGTFTYKRTTHTLPCVELVVRVENVSIWNRDDVMLWVQVPVLPVSSAGWLTAEFEETGAYPLPATYVREVQ